MGREQTLSEYFDNDNLCRRCEENLKEPNQTVCTQCQEKLDAETPEVISEEKVSL